MTEKADSTPWTVREVHYKSPIALDRHSERVRYIIYNRYGDGVAECWYEPDAERICAAVNGRENIDG